MKKLLSLLVCASLLLGCVPALAEAPVTLEMMIVTNANYNHGDPERDTSIEEAIEERVGVNLEITWIAGEGSAEKVSTLLASNDLPDIFTPCVSVSSLVSEGAILALDPYEDKIVNYLNRLDPATLAAQREISDGQLYQIGMLTDYKPAYTMCYRQDWLDNLGIEKVPETIDEWVEVWKAIRDGDPNKNGDPNDEIPFVDPPTFTSGKNGHSLLLIYGIKTNGEWYYTDDGVYSMVYEHEKYRDYLELMRMLYSENLIDHELFTNNSSAVASLFNSNIAFSGYQWVNRPQNTTKTLAETVPEVHLAPTVPIKDDDQLIPQRTLVGNRVVLSYELENDPAKLEAALNLINFMYSEEGEFLTNWGIEGKHHTIVDGKPVLNDDIVSDPTFTAARYAGLVSQMFPGVWNAENYNQIVTTNKAYEELSFADRQMVDGTLINWDYYYVPAPVLSTPAYAEYSADILPKIDELRAKCITGAISVDEFFAGYEALKPYGLQQILDEGQQYYSELTK